MLSTLYSDIIYRPLLNLLVFFYNIFPGHDIGLVIVFLTILIRLILAPSFHKSLKSQKAMNDLQPKLNDLREKYKNDKEGQAKAMMDLYKEHKINPLGSCLPLLLQLPVLIALYQVFNKALNNHLSGLYSFVHQPEFINPKFLGLVDLSKPSLAFGIVAGLAQFWQSKMMMPNASGQQDTTAKAMQLQTTYVLPVISVIIAIKLPAGLPLYWIVTTLFAVAQQYYIIKKHPQPKN
ncbi:MAG: YidC/Oxa1 family membrane protein insertase [Candidatus Shapirobacteria bacterium]|nr:YidC/Oxa1 family membrane protein insertase [Candidatus Shapirobacteria bacterium]